MLSQRQKIWRLKVHSTSKISYQREAFKTLRLRSIGLLHVQIVKCLQIVSKSMKINFLSVFLEAYFRHLLGALPAWNTLFELLCGIFASQIFYELTCYLNGGSYLNYPNFTKTCSFSFTLYVYPGNYADIWPRINKIYRYQPQGCFCFSSFISF